MSLQVLRVRGSKMAKRFANKQFRLLCEDYNQVVQIVDGLKEILDKKQYNKGDIHSIPTAFEAINSVYGHASMISADLENTIAELTGRLREIDSYKESHAVGLLTSIRIEYMTNLVIYLREMKKEVDAIADEIWFVINTISEIEEFEELKFFE